MSARISWLDVKLGIRMMVKHPALTLVGGLGIAVGIAISAGFYSFSVAYIYPTLPLDEGERVVALENRDVAINNEDRQSLHDFFTWREELESVEDLTAFRTVSRNLIMGDGAPELVQVAQMTAAGFALARVPPLLGRHLVEADEREGAAPVVVIGHDVWQNRFAGETDVTGRSVRLGRDVHTIVGVMPEGYAFPENHRYWTPLRERPSTYARREGPAIFIAGRLAPGATMELAQAELSAIGQRTAAAFPETHELIRPLVMPYTHSLTDVQGIAVWEVVQMNLMMGLLLLVVALNVAVLIYARTAARHGEIVMRSALGASRGRIIAQLFVESLVLSVCAAAAGIVIAQVGIGLGDRIMALEMDQGSPFWMDYGLRPSTVLLAAALAVITAVVTGVLPAFQATGRRLQADLRQVGSSGVRLGRTWSALIVVQVAVAVAALPAAVNMGWTEIRAAAARQNYPAEEFIVASLAPEGGTDVVDESAANAFGERLPEVLDRIEADPAVAGVTFMSVLPGRESTIRVEDHPVPAEYTAGHPVSAIGVHPGFAEVFGARMLAGRSLSLSDLNEAADAVIVTGSFVERVLGGGEALGRRIRHVSEEERAGETPTAPVRWYEIVGVMEDLTTNRAAPELIRPALFYPVSATEVGQASLRLRLRGTTPADFAPRLRQIVADVDPLLRLGTVRSLADSDAQRQLAARLVGLAVGLVLLSVLLLSAAGIYAMMSFTVTQRRKEIGIRTALGAQPAQVLRSVFARAIRQLALGLVIGVAAAAGIERATGGGLVDGRGVVLLPALAITMAIVGVLAALGPARRGLSIEPTEALRADG